MECKKLLELRTPLRMANNTTPLRYARNAAPYRIMGSLRYGLQLTVLFLCFFWTNGAEAAVDLHPLAPPNVSSPRATLKTFLDTMNDATQAYKAGHEHKAVALAERAARCLNLEKEPPALRHVMGFYMTLYLKETLDRIEIPPYDEIPDAKAVRTEKMTSWTIPYTEISIALVSEGSSTERFLFSSDTVRNAESYYEKVKDLPYTPQSGGGALLDQLKDTGSLIVPKSLVERLPNWARTEIFGEATWQWIGLIIYFGIAAGTILLLYKGGGGLLGMLDEKFQWGVKHSVGGLILPVTLILFSHVGLWFIIYGLRFLNADVYMPIAFVFLLISYGARIWLIGAVLNRIAAIFVFVGGIVRGGVDDQLVRLGFQALSVIIVGVMMVNLGARLGLPTYSLITGLGIGGLAVALAGREALSNVIGTVMIILDRPFKLGDYIVLGEGERGEVTEVGLRSTRIRTRDDILISIPNSVIANAKMINESAPVPASRIRVKIGVAYGSDLAKVEEVWLKIVQQNELVLSHPAPRIRFRRFGDSALDLELLCWIDPPELRGRIIHQLSWAIHEEFRKQGIEIPFPQRDIHIRTDR
ncbi:mechanosensitive ion channel family protein [Desulfomonile tiedjei]|uniref:Small-conductance mechanosensitive channel n=1 Tax=Desulfomonile tiedjei (strain ATCC 49306 / DSM 6799 / DCB-1) TaxID=706587 RepID=I4C6I5_DESTA|nr:mechanosensitive ion channel family protein [Desulfomonile tiedjei]AFM25176.1 small-conductance mechanosensitive channel [Desulfomonile tiedjei DSM 6799]